MSTPPPSTLREPHSSRVPASRQAFVAVGLLVVVTAIAVLGSLATVPNVRGWYAEAEKVAWNPPGWVFGPAWSLLYLMIALAGFLLWRAGRTRALPPDHGLRTAYVAQLALNVLWTPVFFAGYPLIGATAWWIAMGVLLALIISVAVLIPLAARRSRTSAALLAPYLLWLLFAATLNAGIIALN
ncbi:TspO/MBR family protein [Brevibacterium salitolerans]|uniref:Tryptophan-rich sensory protein n=1 Tax=Brevibacterium salitolerans TaxID=1403566 RepID=A0ABP5IS24_9MICO